jgi:hypothetical protein
MGHPAFYLVSESDADREPGLPFKQIDRMGAGLDRRDFKSPAPQLFRHVEGVPVVLPGNGLFRAQGCLADGILWRVRGDAAEASLRNPTPSAARKNAPTLYMLRTLSSRTAAGSWKSSWRRMSSLLGLALASIG